MAPTLLDQWLEIRDEMLFRQQILIMHFEEKQYIGEQLSDQFKDGLRFATYLKMLFQLVLYPVNLEECYNKLHEIYTLFLEAEFYFDGEHITSLRLLFRDLQILLEGNQEITMDDIQHAIFLEPDPANENDLLWVPYLMNVDE